MTHSRQSDGMLGWKRFTNRSRKRRQSQAYRPGLEPLEARRVLAAAPVISEFMASNDSTLKDGDGNASDWVEILNAGDEAIDLAGWHLTDDAAELNRWAFPAGQPSLTVLEPGQLAVVFASGTRLDADDKPIDPYIDAAGRLHANFRLDKDGEYLALVGPTGVVSEFGTADTDYPEQYTDISYGTTQSVAGPLYYLNPSPGVLNGAGVQGIVTEEVNFSAPGQTYLEPFDLALSSASGGPIYYTLDGSMPDESSSVYGEPIPITSTVQVRASVIEPNQGPGPVHSESFIRLTSDLAGFTSPLPILVIENFDAGEIPNKREGLDKAGTGFGVKQVAHQPVQMEIFQREDGVSSLLGQPDLATRAGVRVHGGSSATPQVAKNALNIETWGETDDDENIGLLGMPSDSDWVLYAPGPEFDKSLLHNTFAYELSREMGRYAVQFQFVEVFLNTDGGSLSMDDHDGLYVLMEKIKHDANRLDFDPLSIDGTQGGWMIQANRYQPIPIGATEHPPVFHTKGPNRQLGDSDDIPRSFLNFESPRGEDINQAQIDSIVSWFDEFEDVLYGPDFLDPEIGYRAYIDVDSFIDHMHMTNLALSVDVFNFSTYLLKRSENDKLELGPVWDFDRAFGSDNRGVDPTQQLRFGDDRLWMPRLFEDPDYAQQWQDRWQELREGPFSIANMHAIIDRQVAEITEEVAAANGTDDWPTKVQFMKDWLADRVLAIDDLYLGKPGVDPAGTVIPASLVEVSASEGTVYYTTDGTDPRELGGSIAAHAMQLPGGLRDSVTLVAADAPTSAIVPNEAFATEFGMSWNGQDDTFDDSEAAGWKQGTMGVGFDETDSYNSLIGLDLLSEMLDVNRSMYTRTEFTIDDASPSFDSLQLNLRYDDGFIAYLNGVEVARDNSPSDATWNSEAPLSRRAHVI